MSGSFESFFKVYTVRMTGMILGACLFMLSAGCSEQSVQTDFKVISFNMLCSFCDATYPPWDERLEYFKDIFDRYDADLIGLQELTWPEEVQQVLGLKEAYKAVYFIGDEAGPFGLTDYPDATILYKADRFLLKDSGNYWLSPTPDDVWSTGFADGAQFPRIVTWAVFEDKSSGLDFLFVNTHFDNNSPSQELSAPVLLERTRKFAEQLPVVITGDFNSQPQDKAYSELIAKREEGGLGLENAFDLAPSVTVEGQDPTWDPASRIDHIFVGGSGSWACPQWTVDVHKYGDPPGFPSDHRAIEALIDLRW